MLAAPLCCSSGGMTAPIKTGRELGREKIRAASLVRDIGVSVKRGEVRAENDVAESRSRLCRGSHSCHCALRFDQNRKLFDRDEIKAMYSCGMR